MMFENALVLHGVEKKKRIAAHTLVSAGLVALAVLLPQLVHLALGQPGGVQLLPMYLPVLIGGCLLGSRWAIAVGALSPVVSFLLTSTFGEAMPALPRLPFMVAELVIFALVSGLFSGKIAANGLWAFPAVILAQLAGRGVFLALVAIFQSAVPFTVEMIWGQILGGWLGLLIQFVIIPPVIIGLRSVLLRDSHD